MGAKARKVLGGIRPQGVARAAPSGLSRASKVVAGVREQVASPEVSDVMFNPGYDPMTKLVAKARPGWYVPGEPVGPHHEDCPGCMVPDVVRREGWPMPCPMCKCARVSRGLDQTGFHAHHYWNCPFWLHYPMARGFK